MPGGGYLSLSKGLKEAIEDNITGLTDSVYPMTAPPKASLPYATYQHLNTFRYKALDGYTDSGYTDYQVNLFDLDYANLDLMYIQFISYFLNFKGLLDDVEVQDVEILFENEDSEYVAGTVRNRKIIDIRFKY